MATSSELQVLWFAFLVALSPCQNPNNMPKEYPRPGLGDYLVGIATTFVVGLLTDRAFVMEDSALTEVVDVGEINWRVSEDVPMHDGQDGALPLAPSFS